jgi:hypothetical protein
MDEKMLRREFTEKSIMALVAGVAISITGCDDDGPSSASPQPSGGPQPGTGAGDVSGSISANHGHVATVTAAQITARNSVVLDIRGTADHTHSVELSAEEVSQIGSGQRVSAVSAMEDGHDHTVTFN